MKSQTIKLFFAALLGISFLSSCLKDSDNIDDVPRAALTLVNAYTPAEAIIQMADNNYLTSAYAPLTYNSYTPAEQIKFLFTGNRKIKTLSSDNKVLVDTVFTFNDKTFYTSFVYGTADKAKQIITEDKVLDNLGNKAGIRFFHLANNIGKVNVYVNTKDTPIYSGRANEEALIGENLKHQDFVAQSSGSTNIIITDESNNTLVERRVDLAEGRYFTILLTGDKNSTDKPLYVGFIKQ